jgi:hypothetical protein
VAALRVVAAGEDLLLIDRTGGGKSTVFMVPAVALWKAAVVDGEELPAIALLVVPYIALGESQHAAMQRYLARLWRDRQLPRPGDSLFVRRDYACGDDDDDSEAAVVACPAAPTDPAATAAPLARVPVELPCGRCAGCAEKLKPQARGRIALVGGKHCCWSCKVGFEDEAEWCSWCRTHPGNRCSGCEVRLAILAPAASDAAAPLARTRRESCVRLAATPLAAAASAQSAAPRRPLRLDDLPRDSIEWRIRSDPNVVLVVVTGSALAGSSERSHILRLVLGARRLRLAVYDEAHVVHPLSIASFAPAVARIGYVLDQIDAAFGRRAQRLAMTSTLPPAIRSTVIERLRLNNPTVVRGPIDRTAVRYFRIALDPQRGETFIDMGVRTPPRSRRD